MRSPQPCRIDAAPHLPLGPPRHQPNCCVQCPADPGHQPPTQSSDVTGCGGKNLCTTNEGRTMQTYSSLPHDCGRATGDPKGPPRCPQPLCSRWLLPSNLKHTARPPKKPTTLPSRESGEKAWGRHHAHCQLMSLQRPRCRLPSLHVGSPRVRVVSSGRRCMHSASQLLH